MFTDQYPDHSPFKGNGMIKYKNSIDERTQFQDPGIKGNCAGCLITKFCRRAITIISSNNTLTVNIRYI